MVTRTNHSPSADFYAHPLQLVYTRTIEWSRQSRPGSLVRVTTLDCHVPLTSTNEAEIMRAAALARRHVDRYVDAIYREEAAKRVSSPTRHTATLNEPLTRPHDCGTDRNRPEPELRRSLARSHSEQELRRVAPRSHPVQELRRVAPRSHPVQELRRVAPRSHPVQESRRGAPRGRPVKELRFESTAKVRMLDPIDWEQALYDAKHALGEAKVRLTRAQDAQLYTSPHDAEAWRTAHFDVESAKFALKHAEARLNHCKRSLEPQP